MKKRRQGMRDKPAVSSHTILGPYTPSTAWMRAVEGFFATLSRQRRKPAIFNSLGKCIAAIETYIEHHNANDARPFRWSKKPEDLVEAWRKGHQKLQESAS